MVSVTGPNLVGRILLLSSTHNYVTAVADLNPAAAFS
jgi:hypothetical protein